ncbi:putative transcription factor C2H2 family [Medicago truncatula]|uniref:RING-type E3 ubiquitin transferase n=1 Tax=Medicago truncatula TaxID=3880 RepID=A0A072TRD2_MEDTR|nr:RING-H2 finger protein ATL47 [Medicago truncatula]KEH19947.1 RING-H2 finger protein ATL47 [Medicago truncatula]RHN41325.1 putative transcription factor C2H2 family [Medicago truncatula]
MNHLVIFIIVILAIVFFISGILQLFVRFLIRKRSSLSNSQSNNNYPQMSEPDPYQRQLQQLFNLHDSGLDQAFIDALPVFLYKEIIGLKEPFDCAVCLCQFTEQDMLRLLPLCNHAFHIDCIDTWLLSNSTCPLCRGSLYEHGFAFENPVYDFESLREEDRVFDSVVCDAASVNKHAENHIMSGKRVFSVRLGKFRSSNNGEGGVERNEGECSSTTKSIVDDVRRCYSMGSYQYVVADSDLVVALCPNKGEGGGNSASMRQLKGGFGQNGNCSIVGGDVEGKKMNVARKGESFSISKIWLWSRKDKVSSSSHSHMVNSNLTSTLPWMNREMKEAT